jgi:hypothetical protein
MQCPHCHSEIEVKPHTFALGEDQDGSWQVSTSRCKVCDRLIVELCAKDGCTFPVRPVSLGRPRLSADVPAQFEAEYHTACQVLAFSPESSAAISRRLLQRFLASHTTAGDLELGEQIGVVTESPEVQPYLKEALRTLALGAKIEPQSNKSLHPEALTPVEAGEADWILDVLQTLFEVYFVQPARLQRMQNALEEKVGPLAPPPAAQPAIAENAGVDEAESAGEGASDGEAAEVADELPADEAPTILVRPLVPPPLP